MAEALQPQPPTDAAIPPGPEGMAAASPQPSAHEDLTPPELDVVETLRRLNETSTWTGGSNASAASGSSSPRSAHETTPPIQAEPAQELGFPSDPVTDGYADKDGYEEEVPGRQRRTKRYRPIAEIYRAVCEARHIKNKKGIKG